MPGSIGVGAVTVHAVAQLEDLFALPVYLPLLHSVIGVKVVLPA